MADSSTVQAAGAVHRLESDLVHFRWDNSIPPRLEIETGDSVVFRCRDDSDGLYNWDSKPADVMKRVAAPMVGGLLTSAFLTLEIIPVVYTYWRWSQLRRERARWESAA